MAEIEGEGNDGNQEDVSVAAPAQGSSVADQQPHHQRRGEEVGRGLCQERQPQACTDRCRYPPAGATDRCQDEVGQTDQPKGDHVVVLRAGGLQHPHRQRGRDHARQHLPRSGRTEPLRQQRHADHAPYHAEPLHQVEQPVIAGQDVYVHEDEFGPGGKVELSRNVRRVVRDALVLDPVHHAR